MKLFEFQIVLFIAVQNILCFQWSASPFDNKTVYVIAGNDVTFPWSYGSSPNEHVQFTKYFFNFNQTLAIDNNGVFMPQGHFSSRVVKHPPAGLVLRSVTEADSGKYTITVEGRTDGASAFVQNRTVNLIVGQNQGDFLMDIQQRLTQMELYSQQQTRELDLVKTENRLLKTELNQMDLRLNKSESRENSRVAFHARWLESTNLTIGDTMKYGQVDLNIGGGYSKETGNFTAPYSGVYYLSTMNAGSKPDGLIGVYMDKGKNLVSGFSDTRSDRDQVSFTANVTCHLNQNETIRVIAYDTALYIGQRWRLFLLHGISSVFGLNVKHS